MTYSPNYKAISLLFSLMIITLSYGQEKTDFELSYEIKKVYPSFSVTKDSIKNSTALKDIKYHYETKWIKDYLAVETTVVQNGVSKKLVTKDDKLTQEQIDLLLSADNDKMIDVVIDYIPQNTLVHNDPRKMDFSISIEPSESASFPGGKLKMKEYLKEDAIEKVKHHNFKQYHLTAIKFAINENGEVVEAKVSESSSDKEVDQILLDAICDMPRWTAAKYDDGTAVKEEFVFLVGDASSCVANLYNTRSLLPRDLN